MSTRRFMREYWQRKPLLIRAAMPEIVGQFEPRQLLELATRDDVESRLVRQRRGQWSMTPGPFDADELEPFPKRRASLLVQGVDLHAPAAHALLMQFRFIPYARLDDVMISYASPDGGVGPHVDSYDVFLLQAHGRRRWRISTQKDLRLVPNLPLKILESFVPEQEWVLEPGDMLYLPPHVAHDGVALDECMTCSIGFRAPSGRELASEFLFSLAEQTLAADDALTRYVDAGQPPTDHPGRIPDRLQQYLEQSIREVKWTKPDLSAFLGRHLSEPKPSVFFSPPDKPLSARQFLQRACQKGLTFDCKTIALYDKRSFFINGEAISLRAGMRHALSELSDTRWLTPKNFVTLSNDSTTTGLFYEWYLAGWIHLG